MHTYSKITYVFRGITGITVTIFIGFFLRLHSYAVDKYLLATLRAKSQRYNFLQSHRSHNYFTITQEGKATRKKREAEKSRREGCTYRAPTVEPGNIIGTTYSIFCTCSRICSISTFNSTAACVVSLTILLDERVLASRLSSCIKKSRRRPSESVCLRLRLTSIT